MLKSLAPYLMFNGEAADAIALYEDALGAVAAGVMRWGDMPGSDLPADVARRVMHGCLKIGGFQLNLADHHDQEVSRGDGNRILMEFETAADLDRCFAALAETGTVHMPVETTFWNARYGEVIDRFGVHWKMNCDLGPADPA